MIFIQSHYMTRSLILFLVVFFYSGIGNAETKFLCFSEPEYPQEKLCYPLGIDPSKDKIASAAVLRLAKNLDSPIGLIAVEGEMRKSYDDDKITSALNEYYSREILESIYQLITVDKQTYVLMENGSALRYSHEIDKIVFSFSSPTAIIGVESYYGSGSKTQVEVLRGTESNCNLEKDGINFLSPSKDNFLYDPKKTICGYRGHFFYSTEDNEVKIGRFDQIGQGWITLHGDFYKFLLWMNEKS